MSIKPNKGAVSPFIQEPVSFPSLGASSLNRVSEASSAFGGLPSLAAAQARSMTRK